MFRLAYGVDTPNHGMFKNYMLDSDGNLFNIRTGRKKKPAPDDPELYPHYSLFDAEEKKHCVINVHKLVAYNFLDRDEIKEQVNHKDGNKHNNRLSNLEWNTPFENMQHAVENDLSPRGEKSYLNKYPEEFMRQIVHDIFILGESVAVVAKKYDVPYHIPWDIKRRKTWKWLIKEIVG